jgi:hypothetical protein
MKIMLKNFIVICFMVSNPELITLGFLSSPMLVDPWATSIE